MSLQELTVEIPDQEVIAVEYPGFVRNTHRALQTLGGTDAIATAVSSKQQYLKLKHRPEDRTSHPLYGERVENTRLLLRIAQPRAVPPAGEQPSGGPSNAGQTPELTTGAPDADGPAATASEASAGAVTASIVARVTPSFRFPGLADFAFIPHDPLLPNRKRESLPYDQRADRAEPTKTAQPFLLIPQLFSWLDLPQDYAFRQLHVKQTTRGVGHAEPNWGDAPVISFYAEGVPPPVAAAAAPTAGAGAGAGAAARGGTQPPAAAADAGDGTAAAAAAGAPAAGGGAAAAGVGDVRAYRVLETEVSRLLAQRPVWALELMRERCARCAAVAAAMPGGCDAAAVERVVQRLCYRFKTGPWRGLFIRRGYDPREDVEARKYQAVVYSLPNNWYRNMLKAGSRPGHPARQQQQQQGGGGGGGAEGAAAADVVAPHVAALLAAPRSLDDLHNFRTLPTSQSTTLQLCDLQLPEVLAVLQEPPAAADCVRCSEKTGWFSNATLQQVQNAVQQRFLQLMDQLAPPGMAAAAAAAAAKPGAAAAAQPGTAPAAAEGAPPTGATVGPHAAAAADGSGGGGDVEMADAGAAAPAPAAGASAGRAASGAAEDALRALMAQMNLRGMAGSGGGGGELGGIAGLFGDDDDGDEFRLLDEQDDVGMETGRAAAGGGGSEYSMEAAAQAAAAAASAGGDDGFGGSGQRRAPPLAASAATAVAAAARRGSDADGDGDGDVTDGEEVAMESEYDEDEDEVEEDDRDDPEEDEGEDGDDEGGGSGGDGRGGSARPGGAHAAYGAYGRVEVPYDGAPAVRQHEYDDLGGLFGSSDEDY